MQKTRTKANSCAAHMAMVLEQASAEYLLGVVRPQQMLTLCVPGPASAL